MPVRTNKKHQKDQDQKKPAWSGRAGCLTLMLLTPAFWSGQRAWVQTLCWSDAYRV